jgi:hypothetical protein
MSGKAIGFMRRSHLNQWVARICKAHKLRDCTAIARGIALAIRHRASPDDAVELERICALANATRRDVLAAMDLLRRAGRLAAMPVRWNEVAPGKWRPAAFVLIIPSADDEARHKQAQRPAPIPASVYGEVEVKRLPMNMGGRLKRKTGRRWMHPVY